MLLYKGEELLIFLVNLSSFITFLIDKGFAFSQEAGHAPQITDNLLSKLGRSMSIKYFTPKVVENNNQFNPSNQLEKIIEEEPSIMNFGGEKNPGFLENQDKIVSNYFNKSHTTQELPVCKLKTNKDLIVQ